MGSDFLYLPLLADSQTGISVAKYVYMFREKKANLYDT